MVRYLIFTLAFLFTGYILDAQTNDNINLPFPEGVWKPQWTTPQTVKYYKNGKIDSVISFAFKGCQYDDTNPNVPYLLQTFEIPQGKKFASVTIGGGNTKFNTSSIPLTQVRQFYKPELNKDFNTGNLDLNSIEEFSEKGKNYLIVKFYPLFPYIQEKDTFFLKKEVIHYEITLKDDDKHVSNENYKTSDENNSVLATGDWYRVGVVTDGIYKIDRNFLNNLGINTDNLNPKRLSLYGKAGGMLPQENNIYRYTDLPEMAITFEGEEDGKFDAGDFITFYGQGPHAYKYIAEEKRFDHEMNLYSDTTFYYLRIKPEGEEGKRVFVRQSMNADSNLTSAKTYRFWEEDKNNLLSMGRMWFGEKLENNRISVRIPLPNLKSGTEVKIRVRAAARGSVPTSFTVREKGRIIGNIELEKSEIFCYFCNYAQIKTVVLTVSAASINDEQLNLEFQYNRQSLSTGWLDFVGVEYEQELTVSKAPFTFQLTKEDPKETNILFKEKLNNFNVWDVSDPVNVIRVETNSNRFSSENKYNRFVVFDNQAGSRPINLGKISNINLHGFEPFDYLVVSHPRFLTHANELAEIHKNYIPNSDGTPKRVKVVNVEDIYKVFSFGSPDLTAIRNFIKLYYNKHKETPSDQLKYVLLFGDGKYDNKGIYSSRSLIPTYQARESLDPTVAYTSDEYLTFMDDNEGFWAEGTRLFAGDNRLDRHTMDLTIGRFPVNTEEEAQIIVNKIKNYVSSPSSAGDWMKRVLLIADYKKGECNHMSEADGLDDGFLRTCASCFDTDKVYYDQFPQVQLAEGLRFPEGKQIMIEKLQEGQLIVNYTGHGSETGLSNSYFFEVPDIQALRNGVRTPFWITATCEFGRYDDPNRVCGIEHLLLNPTGGAISTMTSVRMVYSTGNEAINRNFYNYLFCENKNYTLGEVFRLAKNQTLIRNNINLNTRCFSLLGDPALRLIQPILKAKVTHINGNLFQNNSKDTLKALGNVRIEGEITDNSGALQSNFNGSITVTVKDKPQMMRTNDCRFNYLSRKNRIYQGRASVRNGKFDVSFTVPLDISYEIGQGKISLFAVSDKASASGCTEDIIVCCTDERITSACQSIPEVNVFIDGPGWKSGGITSKTPLLYVETKDDKGINTTGLGVGRQLTAILNNNESEPLILNSFFQTDKDDFKKGTIIYRMPELPSGKHHLSVKVWNVCNNSAAGSTEFEIKSGFYLQNVNAFPNPMTDNVTFTFNYNLLNTETNINVYIYDLSGKLIKTLAGQVLASESLYKGMEWDGTDDAGNLIPAGAYSFKLVVTDMSASEEKEGYGKLIIIRN